MTIDRDFLEEIAGCVCSSEFTAWMDTDEVAKILADYGKAQADRIADLEAALRPFLDLKHQVPESVKLISKKLSGFEPVTVTVTKAQMITACQALGGTDEQ